VAERGGRGRNSTKHGGPVGSSWEITGETGLDGSLSNRVLCRGLNNPGTQIPLWPMPCCPCQRRRLDRPRLYTLLPLLGEGFQF
jgi:hypothetical protein